MPPADFDLHPLVLRQVSVRAVRDVTARMRRVTLGGAQLAAFERDGLEHPAWRAPAFDDHIKLLLSADGPVEPVLPVQTAEGIEWPQSELLLTRDYTPRAVRGDEFDLDFVLHDEEHPGPAEAWARGAAPGDTVWFVGPRGSHRLPSEVSNAVLLADETGLPAIGRFFDERPLDAPAVAVIVIAADEARQELRTRPGDEIHWIISEAGDPDALHRAAAGLPESVWGPNTFVWGGAESRALVPVRKLVQSRGVGKDRTHITGYWHVRPEAESVDELPQGGQELLERAPTV